MEEYDEQSDFATYFQKVGDGEVKFMAKNVNIITGSYSDSSSSDDDWNKASTYDDEDHGCCGGFFNWLCGSSSSSYTTHSSYATPSITTFTQYVVGKEAKAKQAEVMYFGGGKPKPGKTNYGATTRNSSSAKFIQYAEDGASAKQAEVMYFGRKKKKKSTPTNQQQGTERIYGSGDQQHAAFFQTATAPAQEETPGIQNNNNGPRNN